MYNYDPYQLVLPSNSQVNARLGMRFGKTEASIFVNNVLNSHPYTYWFHETGQPVVIAQTLTPRTFGLTITNRY